MTNEPKHEDTDALWADDELSDEVLDRAAGQGGKARSLLVVSQVATMPGQARP